MRSGRPPTLTAPAVEASRAGASRAAEADVARTTERDAPEATFDGTVAADLAVAVSPSSGRFRPAEVAGGLLPAGSLLGHVTGGRGRADEVRTPVAALLRDLLVRPGQMVAQGQALAWLQRVAGDRREIGWEGGA